MNARRTLTLALEVLAAALLLALVLGQALGQPVALGYVETGSMEPTIDAGDGFVVVPAVVAGPPERGDVVVYEATELHGGGLTTHRVVGETAGGYVTKGDANPFTDQDGPEPPVPPARVRGVAVTVGGGPLVVPHLGDAVGMVQGLVGSLAGVGGGLGVALLVGGGALYVAGLSSSAGRTRERGRERDGRGGLPAWVVLAALVALVVVPATASMLAAGGVHQHPVVSAETEAPAERVVLAGDRSVRSHTVTNGGVVPTVAYLDAGPGVELERSRVGLAAGASTDVPARVRAPDETGYYTRTVTEHHYLAVLPAPLLDALYAVNPLAPVVAVDALLAVVVALPARALLGDGRVRLRDRRSASGR
jgi:signal peptidase